MLMWKTGGSALMAVDVLRSRGVPEDRILFLNLIASPEGTAKFSEKYPKLRIVTAFVDQGLNEKKYVPDYPLRFMVLHTDIYAQLHRSWSGRFWRSILYPLSLAWDLQRRW